MTHYEEYNKIIDFRKANPLPKDQYGENHHIVPRSICPLLKKSPENIVRLSAQEHFLAHYHIWKAFRDEFGEKTWAKKMCYAFRRMKQQLMRCNNIEEMSTLYAEVKSEFSKIHSEAIKGNKNRLGKAHSKRSKRLISQNTKAAMSDSNIRENLSDRLKGNQNHKGHHFTAEKKAQISSGVHLYWKQNKLLWFNNGVINVRTKSCPEGFVPGRLKK